MKFLRDKTNLREEQMEQLPSKLSLENSSDKEEGRGWRNSDDWTCENREKMSMLFKNLIGSMMKKSRS